MKNFIICLFMSFLFLYNTQADESVASLLGLKNNRNYEIDSTAAKILINPAIAFNRGKMTCWYNNEDCYIFVEYNNSSKHKNILHKIDSKFVVLSSMPIPNGKGPGEAPGMVLIIPEINENTYLFYDNFMHRVMLYDKSLKYVDLYNINLDTNIMFPIVFFIYKNKSHFLTLDKDGFLRFRSFDYKNNIYTVVKETKIKVKSRGPDIVFRKIYEDDTYLFISTAFKGKVYVFNKQKGLNLEQTIDFQKDITPIIITHDAMLYQNMKTKEKRIYYYKTKKDQIIFTEKQILQVEPYVIVYDKAPFIKNVEIYRID